LKHVRNRPVGLQAANFAALQPNWSDKLDQGTKPQRVTLQLAVGTTRSCWRPQLMEAAYGRH
jgi:hypothetical protein